MELGPVHVWRKSWRMFCSWRHFMIFELLRLLDIHVTSSSPILWFFLSPRECPWGLKYKSKRNSEPSFYIQPLSPRKDSSYSLRFYLVWVLSLFGQELAIKSISKTWQPAWLPLFYVQGYRARIWEIESNWHWHQIIACNSTVCSSIGLTASLFSVLSLF